MKERVHSEGLCEYGRIMLKWILRNCMRMDFEYSCFVKAFNDFLMSSLKWNFHKILWNILTSQATIGISGNTIYWMCLVLWSVVYCFLLMCIFSASHSISISAWKCSVLRTTIRSNLKVSKWCCLYSVTSVRALGCFLSQWIPLLFSVTFTVNCQNKCLSHSSGCCAFALLLSIVLHGNCY